MDTNIEVSRVMTPDDSNFAGNVHGGTILKMIEEAGFIIATRHCNQVVAGGRKGPACYCALVRVERTDFLQPMYINEVAQIHAELTFASAHSLEVSCTVFAENVIKGERRLTNRASLWYVPVTVQAPHEVVEVPPLVYKHPEEHKLGLIRYEMQKRARAEQAASLHESDNIPSDSTPGNVNVLSPAGRSAATLHSVGHSQSSLILLVHPSDCTEFGYATGGFTMKMMDNVAGIVAYRHCRTNVVTAAIDAVDFHVPVRLGHVMTFTGRITFTSERSLEVEVFVDIEDIIKGNCLRACTAMFTFVSLGPDRLPISVPPLVVLTEAERRRFEQGAHRYLIKKRKRKTAHDD